MNRSRFTAIVVVTLTASALPGASAAQSVFQPTRPIRPQPVEQPTYTVWDGRITGVVVPLAGSGYVISYVTLTVQAPGNHVYTMNWFYAAPGAQFIPRVGSLCRIAFHYEADFARETDFSRPRMVVDELDCDTGRGSRADLVPLAGLRARAQEHNLP